MLKDVTPAQLERYATLVYDKIGVTIPSQKATLLSNRLRRRLRATGVNNYDDYYKQLVGKPVSDPEWQAFLQEITTHETFLFRDEAHWRWLREEFLKDLRAKALSGQRSKSVRIWSAACSTGDEAATIAVCVAEAIPEHAEWKIEIVGTDIGAGAVEQASRAKFGDRAMRNVKPAQKLAYFTPTSDGEWELKANLRKWMHFRTHNLLQPLRERPFDLVILKNVLIYFDKASKKRVIESIENVCGKGTLLLTGASEGASEFLTRFKSQHPWLHCYAPLKNS